MNHLYIYKQLQNGLNSKPQFRDRSQLFIFDGPKVVARVLDDYVDFPGGGIEKGEDAKTAALRESMEEAGALVTNIQSVGKCKCDWPPQALKHFNDNDNNVFYRGCNTNFFIGKLKGFEKPTSEEGDDWRTRNKVIPIIDAIIEILKRPQGVMNKHHELEVKILKQYLNKYSSNRQN